MGAQLAELLLEKNGFYCFESALHVFPDAPEDHTRSLVGWNADSLWRCEYQGIANDAVFFAEDAFGGQFCFHDGGVAAFDPETGAFKPIADDIEGWASCMLNDYDFLSGHTAAHDWQERNGPLAEGFRLVPVTPFVLGGEFDAANLRAVEAVEGMRFRASICLQILGLPDGTRVRLRVTD